MLAEEGLVGRDDGLTRSQGAQDEGPRGTGATDKLDDDADLGVIDEFASVGGQETRGYTDRAGPPLALDGDSPDVDSHAKANLEVRALGGEVLPDALSDRA